MLNQAFVYVVSRKNFTKTKKIMHSIVLANEKLKQVMTEIGVEVIIDKVQALGTFEKERKSPRNTIITLSNDWDVRMVLA